MISTYFRVSPSLLDDVNAEKSVEIFRDLLWCQARKNNYPITNVHISSRVSTNDGGVDASIEGNDISYDEFFVKPGTSFQLKTGTSFKPWQKSHIHKELFGSRSRDIGKDNLGSEVKQCLEQGKRYVIVCFGIDLNSREIIKSRKLFIDFFHQCGFNEPDIDVWGQTQIVGLITLFPSLVLRVSGKTEYQFQSIHEWAKNDDMATNLEIADSQKQFLNDIKGAIRTTNDHLRIIGEPGIGKSRLVLEALSDDDLAPNVIYISHAEDFQKSLLFTELIRSDSEYAVVLVVDECAEKERASIWNILKSIRNKCQLITIDHGPERSGDEAMRIIQCPKLEDKQIVAIINHYIEESNDAERWAPWCDGSPRVAHAVGQNLKTNPDDILKPPATVPIWERFIAGYDDPNSEINQQRLTVLRHIALFQMFGYASPVSDEAKYIANEVNKVDPSFTWGKFQSIVEYFRERRIIQGKTTLFIVPKALHIYLWLDYWKHYGNGFDFKRQLSNLPDGLSRWFTTMFNYAHANLNAQQVVRDILGREGPYDDKEFAVSELGTSFLSTLSEADPAATLLCIERTYGSWSKDYLLQYESNRQNVAWALEKIAIWTDTFVGAARMLLKLGVSETSTHSNNAAGIFCGLFSLAYGPSAPTEAHPSKRFVVLREALTSEDSANRKLGLDACESALSTSGGIRIVGAENQGIRPAAKLWMPETYGEIFDAYRFAWHLLFEISRDWDVDERTLANNVLIDSAGGLLQIEPLSDEILDTIEALLVDEATNIRNVVSFIVDTKRFRSKELPVEILNRIDLLNQLVTGVSLEKHIDRYVINSSWAEERDETNQAEDSLESKVSGIVKRAMSRPTELIPLFHKLCSNDGHKLSQFGFEIGTQDSDRKFLHPILDAKLAAASFGTTQFIGGYLRALRESSEDNWEKLIIKLIFSNKYKKIAGKIIWCSGINNAVLEMMFKACDEGIIELKDFAVLRYSADHQHLDQQIIEKVLSTLIQSNDEEARILALEIAESYYCYSDTPRDITGDLVFQILSMRDFFSERLGNLHTHSWEHLANKYLDQFPEQYLSLFKLIISRFEYIKHIFKAASPFHNILKRIAQDKPVETWEIITEFLDDLESKKAYKILHWLGHERGIGEDGGICPLIYFSADLVLSWIDEEPENRARAIAHRTPKTLDQDNHGYITREILHRYGHLRGVKSALSANFFTDGWSGPASLHYRKRRDIARAWLKGETSSNVIEWLNDYIEDLGSTIKREEIREERQF